MAQDQNPSMDEAKTAATLLWKGWLRNFDSLLIVLAVIGLVVAFMYGATVGDVQHTSRHTAAAGGLRGALLAVTIAGSALAIGAFIGFLFGLPRTLTSNELRNSRSAWADLALSSPPAANTPVAPTRTPSTPSATSSTQASGAITTGAAVPSASTPSAAQVNIQSSYSDVNTNLEQISDWLTKIIVGVGLTQLTKIPEALDMFGARAGAHFGASGPAFAVGAGLSFLTLGFFFAYVGTRVKLSHVFVASQRNNAMANDGIQVDEHGQLLDKAFTLAASVSPIAGKDEAVKEADATILHIPLTEINTIDQMRARANALARSNQPRRALDLYNEFIKQTPLTPDLLIDYAQVLALAGKEQTAKEVLSTATRISATPAQAAEEARKIDVATLRGEVLSGLFQRDGKIWADSLAAIEKLRAHPDQSRDDPWLDIWQACAEAARYRNAADRKDGSQEAVDAQRAVEDAVARALKLDPTKKDFILSLYDPSRKVGDDDDLNVFWGKSTRLDELLLPSAHVAW